MVDNKELAAQINKSTAPTAEKKVKTRAEVVMGMFKAREKSFSEALSGTGMSPERFTRIMITEVTSNQDLMAIAIENPVSLLAACMEMAQLGLDPASPNEAFLVPFGKEVTLMPGYKGLQKLAIQAANDAEFPLKELGARAIYANDTYEREFGDETKITHRPPKFGEPRGDLIGFYAIAKDVNGKINHQEMTVAEARKHKDRFSKSKKGPFAQEENFEAFGLKTVLRRLIWRDLPMGPKLTHAMGLDPEAKEMGVKPSPLPIIDITPTEPQPDGDPNEGGLIPGVDT